MITTGKSSFTAVLILVISSTPFMSGMPGEQGRLSMTRALINGPKATLH